MNHSPGLLQAILDDPDSDELRLIYADWLEERGDPRGEFVRLQVELARMSESDARRELLEPRETALLDEYGDQWIAELGPELDLDECSVTFRRGFVEEATFWGAGGAAHLIDRGHVLFQRAPLVDLRLLPTGAEQPRLFPWDQAKFDMNRLSAVQLAAILDLLPVDRLRLLDLSGSTIPFPGGGPEVSVSNRIGDRGAERIASCPYLGRLTELLLSDNLIADRGALALANAPFFSGLMHLDLRFNPISDVVQRELAVRCSGEIEY